MRYIFAITLTLILASSAVAQGDTASITSPTSGDVQSNMPAATTGTAPIDTGVPSGTGTTGTSGTTMAQAEKNNESNSSFVWVVLAGLALAGLIVLMKKKRSRQ